MNILKFTSALSIALMLPVGGHAQTLTNATVVPARESYREVVFGKEIHDPYRWMEQEERRDEVIRFIRQAGDHTTDQLAALPGRQRLRERTAEAFATGTQYLEVEISGDRTFYRRRDADAQFAKLVMRSADGTERILYDPEKQHGEGAAISSYQLSPDGSVIAFHLSSKGAEIGEIRFVDTASGRLLPDIVAPVWGEFEAAWLDNRTAAITRMTSADGPDATKHMQVVLHRLGTPADKASLLGSSARGPAFEPQEFPQVVAGASGDWVLGLGVGARADKRVLVTRRADLLAGRPAWREIATYADEISYTESSGAAIAGDWLYLLSSKGAPNRRLLRLDLAKGHGLADAEIIVPEGQMILTGLVATDQGIYLSSQMDGISRLAFRPHGEGAALADVELPMRGSLGYLQPTAERSGAIFVMQDWFTAPRWFRADAGKVRSLGIDWTTYAGTRGWRQVTEEAVSADGTHVPLAILLPGPETGKQPRAMLLEGYGSYGINTAEPYYARHYFGLIGEGGAVAFCGTRGGGERGRAWHEAGRGPNKPNSHADFVACGERLVELGLTTPERMTVIGTSAGGLLASPAALKRPDLFRSMILNVASLNPTRLASEPNGPNQYAEMGDPGTEEGFRDLLRTDAYQILGSANDMPDTLLLVGLNDNRVAPWNSAKYAARALELFGARRLALVRTDAESGHGIGSSIDVLVETLTDSGAFVLNRAGAEGFSSSQ